MLLAVKDGIKLRMEPGAPITVSVVRVAPRMNTLALGIVKGLEGILREEVRRNAPQDREAIMVTYLTQMGW